MRKNKSSQGDLLSQAIRAMVDLPVPDDRLEQALASTRKVMTNVTAAKHTPHLWYQTRLARATAVAMFVLFGILLFSLFRSPASAAERFKDAIKTNSAYKGWVHMTYEFNEAVEAMTPSAPKAVLHINTADATLAIESNIGDGRRIQYRSPVRREYVEYSTSTNEIQLFDLSDTLDKQIAEMYSHFPLTVPDLLSKLRQMIDHEPFEVKVTKDGNYDRFDITLFESEEETKKTSKELSVDLANHARVWIDPKSKLIHRISGETGGQPLSISISYGEPVIRDIYDLGISRKTKVIDNRLTLEVGDVLDRLDKRISGFGDYVALIAETPIGDDGKPDHQMCAVHLIAQQEPAWLFSRYLVGIDTYSNGKPRAAAMEIPKDWPALNLTKALERLEYKKPSEFFVYDGTKLWSYYMTHPPGSKQKDSSTASNLKVRWDLPNKIWVGRGRLSTYGAKTKVQSLSRDEGFRQIGLQIEFVVYRTRSSQQKSEIHYWYDPARDDMPVERIARDYAKDGKTVELEFHTRYLGYSQLPGGSWYPNHWQTTTTRNLSGKLMKSTREYHLSVYTDMNLDKIWFTNPVERHRSLSPF